MTLNPGRAAKAVGATALAALALFSLVGFGLGTGDFDVPKWMGIFLLSGATMLYAGYQLYRGKALPWSWPDLAVVVFVSWASFSLLWTPDPLASLEGLFNLYALTTVYFAVRWFGLRWWAPLVAALGLVVTLGVSVWQPIQPGAYGYSGGYGNWNDQTEAMLAMLPWIMVFMVRRREDSWWTWTIKVWGTGLLTLCVAFYLIADNPSKIEGYVALAVMLVWVARKWGTEWAILVGFLLLDIALYFAPQSVWTSLTQRGEIWINTVWMWLDSPVWGHGFASFTYLYPDYQQDHLPIISGTLLNSPALLAGEAHSEPLQLLAELGLIGMGIVVTGAILLIRGLRGGHLGPMRTAAFMAVAVITACSAIDFPLQRGAPALVFMISLGLLAGGCPAVGRVRLPRLSAPAFAMPILAAAVGCYCLYVGTANAIAARQITFADPRAAFAHAMKSYDYWPFDPINRHHLYMTFSLWDETNPKIEFGPHLAKKIYGIAQSASKHAVAPMAARARWLLRHAKTEDDWREVADIVTHLRKNASLQAVTWLVDAEYALARHDKGDLARAIGQMKINRQGKKFGPQIAALTSALQEMNK